MSRKRKKKYRNPLFNFIDETFSDPEAVRLMADMFARVFGDCVRGQRTQSQPAQNFAFYDAAEAYSVRLPALPARSWRTVLGLQGAVTVADVDAAFVRLAKQHHPDKGGDVNVMRELLEAREAARAELA